MVGMVEEGGRWGGVGVGRGRGGGGSLRCDGERDGGGFVGGFGGGERMAFMGVMKGVSVEL